MVGEEQGRLQGYLGLLAFCQLDKIAVSGFAAAKCDPNGEDDERIVWNDSSAVCGCQRQDGDHGLCANGVFILIPKQIALTV